jgi:hypothetical protein
MEETMKNTITRILCGGCILIIGVCLSLIGCESRKVVEYVGFVEGTVTDSLTRLPIDSAWISGTSDTSYTPITYTDSSGHYKIAEFPGRYRFIFCGKDGYVTKKSREYKTHKNKTTRVDFELVSLKE